MIILQYCSVCRAELEMELVPTSEEEEGVIWLQCPGCKGFLPKISDSKDFESALESEDPPVETAKDPEPEEPVDNLGDDLDDDELVGEDESTASAKLSLMDKESAVPYKPSKTYQVNDVVHHLAWDDCGVVLEKEVLPGNRHVIKVIFEIAGIVRLIEDSGN
ncbi:hypothetical protein HOD41_04285 [bacterium]|jgi:hypothetical protein|nr:hypothetical protein [bacterium]